jgi:hypothetical protein
MRALKEHPTRWPHVHAVFRPARPFLQRFLQCAKLTLAIWMAGMVFSAQAAQWREVGKVADTGTTVYVDDASLSVDHDTVAKGWVRFDYDKPKERGNYKVSAYASRRMVNCEVNRYWVMEGWGYRKDVEPVQVFSVTEGWQTPAPDSEDEIAAAVLCNETKSIWDKLAVMEHLLTVWHLLTASMGI